MLLVIIPEHFFTCSESNISHLCNKSNIPPDIDRSFKLFRGIVLHTIEEIPCMEIKTNTNILLQWDSRWRLGDSRYSLFFRNDFPPVTVKDKCSVFTDIGHPMGSSIITVSDADSVFPYHRKILEVINCSHCIGCLHCIIRKGVFASDCHDR